MTLSYSFLLDKTDAVHSGRASFADVGECYTVEIFEYYTVGIFKSMY